jgi:hypothetical protein
MSLLEDLRLNDDNLNANEIEENMKVGVVATKGLHHAILEGHRTVMEGRGTELIFLIIGGPCKGMKVKEVVWNPKGDDEAKDKKVTDRLRLFCLRLGILQKQVKSKKVVIDGKEKVVEQTTLVPVEGKLGWVDVAGAQVIIDVEKVEEREYVKDDKKQTIKEAKLSFEGLVSFDDKRAKDVKRGDAGLATPSGGGSSGGSGGSSASTQAVAKAEQRKFDDI